MKRERLTVYWVLGVLCLLSVRAPAEENPVTGAQTERDWDTLYTLAENQPGEVLSWIEAFRAEVPGSGGDGLRGIRVDLLEAVACLYTSQTGEARLLVEGALERSRQRDARLAEARSLNVLGMVTFFTRDYETAEASALDGLELLEELREETDGDFPERTIERLRAGAKSLLGNLATMRADLATASGYYLDALRITDRLGDDLRGTKLRANLGNVMMMSDRHGEAREYYEQALAYGERTGNLQVVLMTLTNLGTLYHEAGETGKEVESYEKALEMARENGVTQVLPTLLINLSDYHIRQGNWKRARAMAEESADLSEASGDTSTYAVSLVNLGLVARGEGLLEEALAKFKEAEKHFLEQDAVFQLEELYQILSETSEEMGRPGEALAYYKKYKTYADRHRNTETAERLEALKAQYNEERQEREIAELQRANLQKAFTLEKQALTNRNQELALRMQEEQLGREVLLRNFLLVGLLVVFLLLYMLVRRYLTEKKAKAELERLNRELSKREEALREGNEDLKRVIQEKDDVLAVVSHDLKNPITGIQGMAELMEVDLAGSSRETREMVSAIRQTADRMYQVVTDLLDAYRINLFPDHDTFGPVDAVGVCRQAAGVWEDAARRKHQTLLVDLPEEPLHFRGNRTRLFQIIDNLLSNAIKYTPKGKGITVAGSAEGDSLKIGVVDEGPGIPASQQEKLFRKFARTAARPTGGEASTGLGLSIVRRLVKSMGGDVWCESEEGSGAAFYVRFPLDRAAARERLQGKDKPLEELRILVVDDNAVHRHLVEGKLVLLGATVESAIHGRDALDRASEYPPDALVLDLHMPELDGFGVIEGLQRQFKDPERPFILCTSATASEEDLHRLRRLGVGAFVEKPLSMETLRDHFAGLKPRRATEVA